MEPILTRESILAAADLKTESVAVPEWGGAVNVRALDGVGRDEFEATIEAKRKDGKVNLRELKVALLVQVLVGADGKPMFSAKDLTALNRKNAAAIDRLFRRAQDMNALGAQAVKELAGNSDGEPSDVSGSDSQKN